MIGDLFLDRKWLVLVLLEDLDETLSFRELGLGRFVEVRTELRESGHLTVLGEVEAHRTRDLTHGFDLGRPADAADRVTHVDRRAGCRR